MKWDIAGETNVSLLRKECLNRVTMIEDKLEDIDARASEEADNSLNKREMDRFIMSGNDI